MNRKLHTKPTFNTTSHLLAKTKSLGVYSLFVILSALFTMTAQAELVDLSNPEPVINFASREANWLIKPDFTIENHCLKHLKSGAELSAALSLIIDEEGKIISVKIIESSGKECIDRMAVRQVRKGRLKPFTLKGDALKSRVTLPLNFVIMDWED